MLCVQSATAQINETQAIRAVVGEASGESYACQLAICSVIRNRGSLDGIYGGISHHVDKEPKWVWIQVRKAWLESATNNTARACVFWGGIMDDKYFRRVLHKRPFFVIDHTRFYK